MTGRQVALVGASGFIGRHVLDELRSRGILVHEVRAPHWRSTSRTANDLRREADALDLAALTDSLRSSDVVINAAGAATATGSDADALVGANALLPVALARATHEQARLVHISSAAVQGRAEVLDESRRYAPFSPYSLSKVLGESVLEVRPGTTCFRPTSVHGLDRPVTQRLHRVLSSRAGSVAGRGELPTPQALVQNVAAAIVEVALESQTPPDVVLQPAEGITCRDLVVLLGGHEPVHVPVPIARAVVGTGFLVGRGSGRVSATARRVEMMWFGQRQAASWLSGQGWTPPLGRAGWADLGRQLGARDRGPDG